MYQVFAIIVTYNPDLTVFSEQLRSLKGSVGFIIVDNASSNSADIPGTVDNLALEEVHFVQNATNMGLATAQNQGIEAARKLGASHVIIFDQDSIPDHRMVDTLLATEVRLLEEGKMVGALGPITYDPDTLVQYPITKYSGPIIKRYFPVPGESTDATFIIASGSLIRMSVLDEVGGMLDDLFIDYIDVEWCYRAQARGYKIFVSADARMSHMVGDQRVKFFGRSISKHSPLRRYYLTRNSFLVMRLPHIPFGYKTRELLLNFARFVAFFYFSDERLKYLKYVKKATVDGLCGNFGKIRGM